MAKNTAAKNPYNICTWGPAAACQSCSLAGRLKCRFNWQDLGHFMGMFLLFAIPATAGMYLGGFGWFILGWLGFMLFFFYVWESRILCRHCPYYAEDDKTLHCIANYGVYKLWRYDPGPMSQSEKRQLLFGFVILGGFPFPFLLLGGQYLLAVLALWGGVMFFWTLRKDTCSQCVNFSCPLNTVPEETVNAYLQRNPTMRQAWEAKGWPGEKTS